jgi:hypothetical protein
MRATWGAGHFSKEALRHLVDESGLVLLQKPEQVELRASAFAIPHNESSVIKPRRTTASKGLLEMGVIEPTQIELEG